mgnify:FL=1
MTLEEYKEKIKKHVAEHNDFNINVENLFNYTSDEVLTDLLKKNTPIAEAALYCILAGTKIKK